MIVDARRLPAGEGLSADVCIVGAGAAGIALALELAKASVSVLLLEAGGLNRSGKSQRLYVGTVNDPDRHMPPDKDRYRQLGGTTSLWGGRCMPLDGLDFAQRDFVPYSGWPLTRADLDPFYQRAQDYCECGPFAYGRAGVLPDTSPDMFAGFDDRDLTTTTLERWSPPTNFGKAYRGNLETSKTIKVLLNAVATEISVSSDGGAVSEVMIKTARDNERRVTARAIVLAGGGLENTRLLLTSNKVHAAGLGNSSGWLGRGYMCHLNGVISRLRLKPGCQVVFGYETDEQGIYCRRRLWISEDAQRRLGLLNMYGLLDRPLIGDPEHGNAVLSLAFLAKRALQRAATGSLGMSSIGKGKYALYGKHLRNILLGSPEFMTYLPKFSRQRFLQDRRLPSITVKPKNNTYYLYFHSEQAPNPDSRVLLKNERDEFGVPRLHIDFRVSELDVESVYRSHLLIGEELEREDIGTLNFEREDPRAHIRECRATLGHHIGTTRMALKASEGVVNKNCRVNGVANLFIAGSSVFPTCGQAHPTLTIVALAIRLASHLRDNLGDLSPPPP